MEEWKEIEGYEDLYEVSSLGRVRSIEHFVERSDGRSNHIMGHLMRQFPINSGYLQVHLHKNGVSKGFLVHRLVAMAFVPNPYSFPIVNHKDENRTNNVCSNLEWCDAFYNSNYGNCRTKLCEKKNRKNISKAVLQYDCDMNLIGEYPSTMEAFRATGIKAQTIGQCCLGRQKKSGGYIWRYKQ